VTAHRHRKSLTVAISGFCILAWGSALAADPIFHWVDEDGIAHFSDWAPEDVEDVTTLVVNAQNPPDYDPAEDPYSISNQAERTSESWKALESQREERLRKKRDAEQQAREASQRREYQTEPWYPRPYFYSPVYRPGVPPGYRPPHLRPPIHPGRPARPVMSTSEWTDPMRSAHIGVRRSPPPNSGKQ
jgi:hypothetical protein